MKSKKKYTLILTSNTTQKPRFFSISQKQLRALFALSVVLLLGFIVVITNYSTLAKNYIELTQAKEKNKNLEEDLEEIKSKFSQLKIEVAQLQDFSRKVKLIATGSNKPSSYYGRVSSQANLMDITSTNVITQASSLPEIKPSSKKQEPHDAQISDLTNDELIVSIEHLKKEAGLAKQDVWNLYSSLLERKEILNSTPSIMPTHGWITSHFGYRNETIYADHDPHFHRGMDIAARSGSPIFATSEGKVTYTGYDEYGYGKMIIIDHGYGVKTYYAHLSQIKILNHTHIKRGDVIGYVGNTGKSTGPHLHYEVRIFGTPVNPINYVLDGLDELRNLK